MWIELVLAPARKALQVCMDPCRVVPGSIRGWKPYNGRINGQDNVAAASSANTYPYLNIWQVPVPSGGAVDKIEDLQEVYDQSVMFSTRAALGLHGAYHDLSIITNDSNPTFGTTALDETAATKRQAIPFLSGAVGVGVPQYVPTTKVWNRDVTQTAVTFAPERSVCFGTYLKASRAQSRRTITESNPAHFGGNYSNKVITYTVINVELVGEQILLPDAVTQEVVGAAASGQLSMHTSFISASYNNAPNTTTQNLSLPVTGASVNNLTFLFRSNVQVSDDDAYAYPSYAFYNPWALCTYTNERVRSDNGTLDSSVAGGINDVGGLYRFQNAFLSNQRNQMDLQVQIGTELYPRQPIQTFPELLAETEKGLHSIGKIP